MSDEFKYYKCEFCDGKGFHDDPVKHNTYHTCQECQGDGEFDWIENIVGKRVDVIFYDTHTGNTTVTLPSAPKAGHVVSIESDPDTDGGIITIVLNGGGGGKS